jgi:hypothetical protein
MKNYNDVVSNYFWNLYYSNLKQMVKSYYSSLNFNDNENMIIKPHF